jgi:hypothetical protein
MGAHIRVVVSDENTRSRELAQAVPFG